MGDFYLGELRLFSGLPGQNPPYGWMRCEGQSLNVQTNAALYSLLGIQYGGDGKTVFNLPDLRGRVVMGSGITKDINGNTIRISNGNKDGTETVALTATQVPAHSHTLTASTSTTTVVASPANNYPGVATASPSTQPVNIYGPVPAAGSANWVGLNASTVGTAGGGQGHENRQPLLAMYWCIAVTGLYPARN